ncbi:N-acetylmuramoyl-L-alanine amidase [Lysinibacillus sp. LZ02]|uniref:N-acetylmuramoyl-L-alanine amidase n=1 Tax=Lysinibacillus sp. LZ02 TaxID=3420668 RepID=UPI003D35EA1A
MITISPGHWKVGSGAVGLIDEVTEARKVVDWVVKLIEHRGIKVHKIVDNQSKNQRENVQFLVSSHNKTDRRIDVSVHFNAIKGIETRAIGTEVLYQEEAVKPLATNLSKAIATAASFVNRGAKKRLDLAFLNNTTKQAVLLEICFVNSTVDVALYEKHFEAICHSIASALAEYIQPAVQMFSSPALHKRVEAIFYDNTKVAHLLQQGVKRGTFLPVWQEKHVQGNLTLIDFCGLCVLLGEEE